MDKVWQMRESWAAVLAAALLYGLACAPYELSLAAWLVPGLLLTAVRGLSKRAAFVRGCFFALLFGCVQMSSARVASLEQFSSSHGAWWWCANGTASALPYVLLAVLYASAFGTVSARVRPVLAAWLWVGAELLRSEMFVGLPLATLGHTQVGSGWMTQAADLGGTYAVTFVMVLISVGCAELFIEGGRNRSLGHPARV